MAEQILEKCHHIIAPKSGDQLQQIPSRNNVMKLNKSIPQHLGTNYPREKYLGTISRSHNQNRAITGHREGSITAMWFLWAVCFNGQQKRHLLRAEKGAFCSRHALRCVLRVGLLKRLVDKLGKCDEN